MTHDPLDLIIQGSLPHPTLSQLDMGPHCTKNTFLVPAVPTGHGTPLHSTPTLPPLVTSGGQDWRPVQTCSLEDPFPPLVLTYGDYWSMYIRRAGSTHPTAMLSYDCYWIHWIHPQNIYCNIGTCNLLVTLIFTLSCDKDQAKRFAFAQCKWTFERT